MQKASRRTWVHTFFYSSRCEWVRHLLLCLLMLFFSFAEMGYHYAIMECGFAPLAILCAVGTLCKVGLIYILILLVIPRLLPHCRYMLFWSVTFLIVLFSILLQHGGEALTYHCYGMPFWRFQCGSSVGFYLLDFCVQFVQWLLVLLGLSVGHLLKYWTTETQKKQRMLVSQLQIETELLKEQVAPVLLCETLHQSGVLAQRDAQKASERLMLLSRLLRYQLYDCRRREVLLDSEVKFLHDYLELLVQNGECTGYSFSVSGQTMGVFVPPLLFVSLVNCSSRGKLTLDFCVEVETLTFRVTGTDGCYEESKVRRRLDRLYSQHYRLLVSSQDVVLTLQLYDYGKAMQ